ncbi:MAG: hypothetical protein IKJ98_07035 [Bacteroidales bacterium]|nr:hypothetical protein [Bacteroidales bacterium]MBR6265435.1 hypothetical protein [Bacteroidales bacterium]
MKKIAVLSLVLSIFVSCTKEMMDGPRIYFANDSEIADTISQSDIITFKVTALGNNSKVNQVQLYVNTTEYFDSTFSATDSITIDWDLPFSGRLRTQNIKIQATDENELKASQTKKIYVK